MTLLEIVQRSPKRAINPPPYLIGLDPGGTTGWCLIDTKSCTLINSGQFKSSFKELELRLGQDFPINVAAVVESYRLYPWKLKDQTWSSLYTPRFIGAIEYVLWQNRIPVIFQTAGQGKNFCKNDKLKEWGMYKSAINGVSQKHANDACRHPAAYLIFGRDVKPELLTGNAENTDGE